MEINGVTIGGGGGGGLHIPLDPVSGRIYGLRTGGQTGNVSITQPNGMRMMPFIPINGLTPASFSVNVTIASAGSNVKILVFSNLNGAPYEKLFESADLSCAATGIKTATIERFSFIKGTTYYIGIIANQTGPSLTSYSINSMPPISETSVGGAANWFVGTTIYNYATIPSTVTGSNFFPASANCPAVWITAA